MIDPLCVFGPDRYALGLLAVLVSAASVPASAGYFPSPEDRRFYRCWTAAFLLSVLECFFSATWLGYLVFLELSTAANVGTVMSFCKMGYYAFGAGKGSGERGKEKESGWMVLGMVLLCVPVAVLGILPGAAGRLLGGGAPELFSFGRMAESLGVSGVGAVLFFFFSGRGCRHLGGCRTWTVRRPACPIFLPARCCRSGGSREAISGNIFRQRFPRPVYRRSSWSEDRRGRMIP